MTIHCTIVTPSMDIELEFSQMTKKCLLLNVILFQLFYIIQSHLQAMDSQVCLKSKTVVPVTRNGCEVIPDKLAQKLLHINVKLLFY